MKINYNNCIKNEFKFNFLVIYPTKITTPDKITLAPTIHDLHKWAAHNIVSHFDYMVLVLYQGNHKEKINEYLKSMDEFQNKLKDRITADDKTDLQIDLKKQKQKK